MHQRKTIEGQIEGEATMRFRLYRVVTDHIHGGDALGELVAEADTVTELDLVKRRGDWRYHVVDRRQPLSEHELEKQRALECSSPRD
jgi:hypothetical protein